MLISIPILVTRQTRSFEPKRRKSHIRYDTPKSPCTRTKPRLFFSWPLSELPCGYSNFIDAFLPPTTAALCSKDGNAPFSSSSFFLLSFWVCLSVIAEWLPILCVRFFWLGGQCLIVSFNRLSTSTTRKYYLVQGSLSPVLPRYIVATRLQLVLCPVPLIFFTLLSTPPPIIPVPPRSHKPSRYIVSLPLHVLSRIQQSAAANLDGPHHTNHPSDHPYKYIHTHRHTYKQTDIVDTQTTHRSTTCNTVLYCTLYKYLPVNNTQHVRNDYLPTASILNATFSSSPYSVSTASRSAVVPHSIRTSAAAWCGGIPCVRVLVPACLSVLYSYVPACCCLCCLFIFFSLTCNMARCLIQLQGFLRYW